MAINFNGKEIIITDGDVVVFIGSQRELTRFISESIAIAERIKEDLDINIVDEECSTMDYKSYKKYANKYGK